MRNDITRALSALTALLLAMPVLAHDSWLSLAPAPAPGALLREFRLSTGHHFPEPEDASSTARIARAELELADRRLPLLPAPPQARWLPLKVAAGEQALLKISLSLWPATIELDAGQVESYLQEAGDTGAAAQRHAELGRWRERFEKHARSLARLRPGPADPRASVPSGQTLELVPRSDPTVLAEGEAVTVCALGAGAPLADLQIGLIEADGQSSAARTGADGCVEFRPRRPSGYLLRSVWLRPSSSAEFDWESHFASLTVFIDTAGDSSSTTGSSP